MKKNFGEYFIGLDIGTDSIGWAVTDEAYNIQKLNGKALWGIRLFDGGQTAEARRTFRSATRRLNRRKQRIKLLQELFAEEISRVDQGFYQRLEDSKFYFEDKKIQSRSAFFNDEDYTDKEYYKEYKTIYHLRKKLIEGEDKVDIRLLYLAIHHILKNRGHFLFEGQKLDNVTSFSPVFTDLINYLIDEEDIDLTDEVNGKTDEISELIKSRKLTSTDKRKRLDGIFSRKDERVKAIATALSGGKVKLMNLYNDESLGECDPSDFKFSEASFDENRDKIEETLGERIYLIDKLKSIYDWGVLSDLLSGENYLSNAKVKMYEKHQSDLASLKSVVKKYINNKYKEIFENPNVADNYASYVGITKQNGKKQPINKKTDQELFCKFLKKQFANVSNNEDQELVYILDEIEKGTLLPKQVNKSNGVIPHQVHLHELDIILENASKHYEFLNQVDSSGITVAEKIRKIFLFRIPYYVGPLNAAHKNIKSSEGIGHCWIERKSEGRILPWNFEQVVDVEASAEAFITRMTNKCSYLIGEDVIPKNSLIYSEYMIFNEINNMRFDDEPLDDSAKKVVIEIFKTNKKVTRKRIKDALIANGFITKSTAISGIDGDPKASLTSYIDFMSILGSKADLYENRQMIENIIRWIVLFGDDRKLLKSRINKVYSDTLSVDEINKIAKLKYSGWGRFSSKFLLEVYHIDKATGEAMNIIDSLRNSNRNLMQLLSTEYDYASEIEKLNHENNSALNPFSYESINDLYLSPAVKRGVWQTMVIVKELVKIMGREPKKVFLEFARGEEKNKKGKTTTSRKAALIQLYKNCKIDERNWVDELEKRTESELRSKRLYLYYTQMGKCMYSGEPINLDELFTDVYDIYHIYPRSKVKHDSINNTVLVQKKLNAEKDNILQINKNIKDKCMGLWKLLLDKGLIDESKFKKLTRNTDLTNEELAAFISRQLVETRQSSKAVAQLLKTAFKDTSIVYVKAGNVSEFRAEVIKHHKVREINDLHHAKDAYLNIVVGNVYDTKFTQNPANFIGKRGFTYNLNRMYDLDIQRYGKTAWKAGPEGTIQTVQKFMKKNNILFTRYSTKEKGKLFDATLQKKDHGQLSLKPSDSRMTIAKYGGYKSIRGSYYVLVEHKIKNKAIRSIEFVPIHLIKELEKDSNNLIGYLIEQGLKEPKIIISGIKKDSLIIIDGTPLYLSSRTEDRLVYNHAVQLILPYEIEQIIKKIIKTKNVQEGLSKKNEDNKIAFSSGEENLKVYDELVEKIKGTIYSRLFSSQITILEKGRERFVNLDCSLQSKVLINLMNLFKCNSLNADLELIGGSKNAGSIKYSKKITNFKSVLLINQSPTGVFEERIDLLTLEPK